MRLGIFILMILAISIPLASAATLKGNIYDENLDLAKDTLVEINSIPQQKFLAKDGSYSFELSPGKYTLTAKNNLIVTTEPIQIVSPEGQYVVDLFLLPDFTEEDQLWNETQEEVVVDIEENNYSFLKWIIAALIFAVLLGRIIYMRKKYGSLRLFRKKIKEESRKTVEQHREELEKEPGHLEQALEIIQKHGGRITQKELRKEMMYLSEAKISLIITELEHKEKVEKIKKGRGNVIIMK